MGHEVNVGEKVSSQINIHEVHQIPRIIGDGHDTQHKLSKDPHSYGTSCSKMDYDSCMYKELTREMIENTETKCLVPWFPKTYSMEQIGRHEVCTLEKDVNTSY